jgi:hypothetical protein
MARTDGRAHSHIQEARAPSAARPVPPPGGEPAAPPERRHRGWRFAVLLWAIMFLFLSALMVFDLIAGLFHR